MAERRRTAKQAPKPERVRRPDCLVADGLTVRFGGVVALRDVSLNVEQGSICGLMGPNGAGKTTLFGVVGGFVRPDRGSVHFNDRDITSWAPHKRAAAGIGRTFQRLELFWNLSAIENLIVAREARTSKARLSDDLFALPRSTAEEAAARAHAELTLELLGIEWARDKEAASLPLGVGRLLEVGRALESEPSLLMLDEPSSGLDGRESAALASVIRTVREERGISILIVEHDVDFVSDLCDEVFMLDFGVMIARGTPDAVRADPAVRAAYLGTEGGAA